VSTPLPGSMQGYVFAHPAEFAACASAVNAAAIEYSGQTVILERRHYHHFEGAVEVDEGRAVAELLSNRTAFPVDWELYADYVRARGYEDVTPGPELDLAPLSAATQVAFQPVAGTRVGIFGADRYVFPDLPAYYEYRLAAYSTAGSARSPVAFTPFVKPLFDAVRQRPTTEGRFEAEFSGDRLILKVVLPHPRLHLRPEMRGLWVTADPLLSLPDDGDAVDVRFGSTPDLYCHHQIYLNANYQPADPGAVGVLNNLVSILPPFDPQRMTAGPQTTFLAKSSDETRIKILPPDLTGLGAAENIVRVAQLTDGAVCLIVPLRFTPESRDFVRPILEAGRQLAPAFDKVFFFSVCRGGVSSPIVPQAAPT
jgi:hypothetical protein